jgi:hypothetical protein
MWSCERCHNKVDDNFEVCWSCGTTKQGVPDPDFQAADAMPPIKDPRYDPIATPDPSIRAQWATVHGSSEDELVVCYNALSLLEAKFLADELVQQGIPAVSDTFDLQDALGAWDGNPRVYCRKPDLEKARSWLLDYERQRKEEKHL